MRKTRLLSELEAFILSRNSVSPNFTREDRSDTFFFFNLMCFSTIVVN